MKTTIVPADKSRELYMALERNMAAFKKRGITYIIVAESDTLATITITVTGRKGVASKNLIVAYDFIIGWQVYSSGYKYTLVGLSEISALIRGMLQKLSSTLSKI